MNNLDTVTFDDESSVEVKSTTEPNISSLCPEMKCLILEYLNTEDLLTFSLVSKEWYHFISSDTIWNERFNRLETAVEEPVVPVFDDLLIDIPVNLYSVSRCLSAEELQEVEACHFVSVNTVKLAFFFYRTSLICNRLLATRGTLQLKNQVNEYYLHTNEEIVWLNYDPSYATNTQFHFQQSYLLPSPGLITDECLHYRHYSTSRRFFNRKAYFTEQQQYYGFLTSDKFLLGLCKSMIHVYRFSPEIGQFNKTHELIMVPDKLRSGSLYCIMVWGKTTSTLIILGELWVWQWDLISGEKMAQVKISNMVQPEVKIDKILLAKESQLVVCKNNLHVLLLDMAKAAVSWEVEINYNQIEVTSQYLVAYQFYSGLFVYDIDTGLILYQVPFPEADRNAIKGFFLPQRGDIIVVSYYDRMEDVPECAFYFDLKNQKQLEVTAWGEPSEVNDYNCNQYDFDDYYYALDNVNSVCSLDFEELGLTFKDGPGETIIEIRPFLFPTKRHTVSLIDYRNNRSIRIGSCNKLFKLKSEEFQVGWDKEFKWWSLIVFRGFGRSCRYPQGHTDRCWCFPTNVVNNDQNDD